MPYNSINAAKNDGFPTSAEGVDLTLAQINKLAEIYDAIKETGTAKNPFSVAWTTWKRMYIKTDDSWIIIKAAAILFGTEQFTASTRKDTGIPEHAVEIEGPLIHLDTKNLAGWGVTGAATQQIIAGIEGVPIRACASIDPHECDYKFDNKSHIGYGVRAWVKDNWIWAAAAITDSDAVKHISDGTWMPFGKGGWSVAGLPTKHNADYEKTGLIAGYQPTGISLVFSPSTPAFVGSGFEMVTAAIHHAGDTMTDDKNKNEGKPQVYDQAALDAAVKGALEKQRLETEAAGKKNTAEELAKQKLEYEDSLKKMTADERTAYDAKLAEMTPTVDVEKMISAAVTQGQADTIETIEKSKLMTEYSGMLTASILGAPFMTDGTIDPAKITAKLDSMKDMKSAAIADMIGEAKLLVAAATPDQTAFNAMDVPGQAPGSDGSDADLLADINAMDDVTGQVR